MEMTDANLAFILIIISAMVLAVLNAIFKSGQSMLGIRLAMSFSYGSLGVLMLPFVPLPSSELATILALTMVVHFAYQQAQVAAYTETDLTIAYPVSRGTAPLVVAVIAPFLLGDELTIHSLAGVIVISLSVLSLGWGRGAQATQKGLLLSLALGLGVAGYTLTDAWGMRVANTPITFMVWFFAIDWILMTLWSRWRVGPKLWTLVRVDAVRGSICGFLGIFSFGFGFYAFRIGNVAELAALREVSIIFAAIISFVFLGEQVSRRRIFAIAGILAGVLIIRLASS